MEEKQRDALDGAGSPANAASSPVFISYASADVAVADTLVATLESRGVACWIAPRDVKAGAHYAEAIVRAISGAKAMILVLSASSVASTHVSKEVERASSKRRPVIAMRIDDAPLSPALEYFLSESHWIDARTGGLGAAIAKVAAAIQDPVGLPSGAVSGVTAGRGSAQQFKSLRSRILPLIGLFVLGLAATVLLAHRFWSPNSATERIGMTSLDSLSDKSIAVLPFADMSEKKDQDYLADGTAEEILDLLAKIPGIAVIGRTSSFQFKDKNVDLRTIGSQLKAAHVLEGSIRRTGDQVRITAQLINSTTGTHEWSETYNRQIGDVLKLQDSIAAAVVREMQLSVAPYALASRPTLKSPEAYDLYLRGRHAGDRWDEQGLDEAISLFRQALDRDPNSAETLAHLANAYLSQATGTLTPAESIEQARSNATKAMTLDSKNVLAHVVMEQIHFIYEWDWVGAEREITEAMKAAPGDGDVLYGEAYLSEILGRWDDALRYINGALAEDPLNPIFLVGLSWIQESRGHLLEAEAALHRALAIRPTQLGVLLLESGDRNGALREMQQEIADTNKQEGLALAYYALGRKAEADAELAAMLKAQSVGNADGIAEVYAFRHQLDDSMHWLERAYAQKDQSLHYIKRDWLLRGLEPDPRYTAFLRKMNFPD